MIRKSGETLSRQLALRTITTTFELKREGAPHAMFAIHRILLARSFGLLLGTLTACTFAGAQTETVLYNFAGGSDGMFPSSGLVFDAEGNLYGTTSNGGNQGCSGFGLVGCGVVYKLAPGGNGRWTESVIHVFSETGDGGNPSGTPVFDSAGNMYGTTMYYALGSGAVWELRPETNGKWNGTVLHAFNGTNGGFESNGVSFDGRRLFGSTFGGGPNDDGLIYHLVQRTNGTWNEDVLYDFKGESDGEAPSGPLIYDAAGNIYGTTYDGGPHLAGTVFELVREEGYNERTLFTFPGLPSGEWPDGTNPTSGLIMDKEGNLYGTTFYGGAAGVGTVFKLSKQADGTWKETVLHTFMDRADGGHPNGLLMDEAGNLYGTTTGHNTLGSVYKLSRTEKGPWKFTVLHDFTGPDGSSPGGPLVMDAAGNLYGATSFGGMLGNGVVFEVTR